MIYLYFLTGSVNEIKFSLHLCEKTHLWCFFFFFFLVEIRKLEIDPESHSFQVNL